MRECVCLCDCTHLLYLHVGLNPRVTSVHRDVFRPHSETGHSPGSWRRWNESLHTGSRRLSPFQCSSMEHCTRLPSQHLLCLREGGANMRSVWQLREFSATTPGRSVLWVLVGCWDVGFPLHQSEGPVSQVTQLFSSVSPGAPKLSTPASPSIFLDS